MVGRFKPAGTISGPIRRKQEGVPRPAHLRMASHTGNTFQKILRTSEGVLYQMEHKVVGSYPPLGL